ncbi:transposase [Deinococcus radiophilus]|uniref:transposase n=1 Tax=Deinococcus radiophilus TaxID=32062 RepID=UPI00361AA398
MWEDYRRAVRQVFGDQAKQVTDRFHLQAKVTEAYGKKVSSSTCSIRNMPRRPPATPRSGITSRC